MHGEGSSGPAAKCSLPDLAIWPSDLFPNPDPSLNLLLTTNVSAWISGFQILVAPCEVPKFGAYPRHSTSFYLMVVASLTVPSQPGASAGKPAPLNLPLQDGMCF